jgi:hypothetical protein
VDYVTLGSDRGFVLYRKLEEVGVSIVSVDLSNRTYELIGNSYCGFDHLNNDYYCAVRPVSCNKICAEFYSETSKLIYLFEINHSITSFVLKKLIPIPTSMIWFNVIGENYVYAQLKPSNLDGLFGIIGSADIDSMVVCREDGVPIKLKKTPEFDLITMCSWNL